MRALKITNSITRRDEKSLEKYFNEISRYDILTPDEEVRLFQEYKDGDEEALSKIVRHNLRFVVSVAKKYQDLGMSLGDLINEGNVGLVKAARRFDVTRGFKFISYAVWWIRQSILQAINDKGRNIRVPLNVTGNMSKVRKVMVEILQKEEREATVEELAEATGLSEMAVEKCLKSYKKCRSLDAPVEAESRTTLGNMMADDNILDPDHHVAVRETQQTDVDRLLKTLPEREATVLSMYYGIGRKHPSTLSVIAEKFGLSRERARQIKDRGLMKLRTRAGEFAATFSEN